MTDASVKMTDMTVRDEERELVPSVKFSSLSFRYEGTEDDVLQDIDFTIEQGEFVLVMGPSGCGKSTLVQTINGVVPHLLRGDLRGHVFTLGKDTRDFETTELAREVGIVFQDPEVQLFALTVEDELAMVLENMGVPPSEMRRRVDWALNVTGLHGLEMRQPARLSGGQKQRVATAATLTYDPSILILDEPTAYLDNEGTVTLLKTVRNLAAERNLTIILVEHKIELVIDLVDRVVIMEAGKVLFDGPPIEVFSNVEVLRRLGISMPRAISIGLNLQDRGMPLESLPPTIPALAEALRTMMPEKALVDPSAVVQEKKDVAKSLPIIEFRDVDFVYGSGNVTALKNISTTIHEGEFVAIVGHNGSGKSTLLAHAIGILTPTRGQVIVDGIDTAKSSVSELAKIVGIVFQNPDHQIFNETIFDEIAYGPRNFSVPEEEIIERVTEALALVDLSGMEQHDPDNLSMGQRQRLAVASVLAMRPKVLALDEPTVGQDPLHLNMFMDMILNWNRQGNTVLMITHDIDFAIEYSSRVLMLNKAEILVDGPPEEVFHEFAALKRSGVNPPASVRLLHEVFGAGAPLVKTMDQTAAAIASVYHKTRGE